MAFTPDKPKNKEVATDISSQEAPPMQETPDITPVEAGVIEKEDAESLEKAREAVVGKEEQEFSESELNQLANYFERLVQDFEDKHDSYASADMMIDAFTTYFDNMLVAIDKEAEINIDDFSSSEKYIHDRGSEAAEETTVKGTIKFKGVDIVDYSMMGDGYGVNIEVNRENFKNAIKKIFE